jgi:hypothetical protein
VVRRAPPDATPTLIPALDRVVASGQPVSIGVMAIRSLDRLAKAVGVPMGLQNPAGTARSQGGHFVSQSIYRVWF